MIYDTHAHYDDEKFDNDRVELLSHLLGENNIGSVVNVGANLKGSQKSIELAEKYPNVYAAIGVHPEDVDEFEKNIANYDKLEAVFINQDVLLSTSQEKMLEKVNTYIIPDCYFDFELREAGELW